MIVHPEYPKNRSDLKICNTIYNIIGKFYIILAVFLILAFIPCLFSSFNYRLNTGLFILLSVFLIPAHIYCEIRAVYKKETKFALAAIAPVVLGLFCASDGLFFGVADVLLTFASLILAVVISQTNKKYNYLAQQEGFPYFSDLHSEQMNKGLEAMNYDPYKRNEQYYVREEVRGVMDDFVSPDQQMKVKDDTKKDYMDSV